MKTENLVYNIHSKHYLTQNNNNKSAKKTTAGQNPSGRLSFKGRADVAAKLSKTAAGKLINNKAFNWFLDVVNKNSLLADALIALGLTAIARPAMIYAIPAKNEVEKKKNNYQVAHSVSTGILGLATTYIVSSPISEAVKKVADNPEKYLKNKNYIKNNFKYIKENKSVFNESAKRIHQPLFLPLRAIATIMLVPPLLHAFGLSKHGKTEIKPQDKAKIDYSFMSFKGNESKSFKGFSKVKSGYDMAQADVKNKGIPSFKGRINDKVVNSLAKNVIAKLADSPKAEKFINWFKNKNWFPHLIAGESLWLSSFYMIQSGRSKQIEKDQKLPMILNQGITALLCTWGAYKLDGAVNKSLKRMQKAYRVMKPEMDQKLLSNRLRGIRLLGPVVIFTAIYRFVGPVLVTPVANWISEKIQPHKKAA